ncbi:aminotransferase class I/II-fold pyridoxal phosphate-dependent enzyme [Micromonospora sp. NPDC048905]|uniref:pyridoxal phosphate-dependent aminotransferase n=1 Tax=Micromonospora sp. NPDC048905 TaxID=3155494 RepID=UPI0033EB7DD1
MKPQVPESALTFPSALLEANPYVPDWAGQDRRGLMRLDRNEAPGPLSPTVAEAVCAYVRDAGVHSYPEYPQLASALGGYCGVPSNWILPTNGSDQGIDICIRAFLRPGASMVVARPEFVIFGHAAGLAGGSVVGVPYPNDLRYPYEEFRAVVAARKPDLIVFVNPNNPTGTPVDVEFIAEIARSAPGVPVLVDEAYYEFTDATVVPLIPELPNLIVLRTFSKAFAMAGLRLGYVVAVPEVVEQLVKLRNPFDVNSLAVVAGLAQLARLREMRSMVDEMMGDTKPEVVGFFRDQGVVVHPGAANFLLVRPRCPEETVAALRAAGILVRTMTHPLLAGMFRMNLGTHQEMTKLMNVYRGVLNTGLGPETER